MTHTLNIRGGLMALDVPKVMGIVNATPDSFFAGSRAATRADLQRRISEIAAQGADIIDVGGASSRSGAASITPTEEFDRLAPALEICREVCPEIPVSVDTFSSVVARRCVETFDIDIINDIGGGTLDPDTPRVAIESRKAYVLMHMRGEPATMQTLTDYADVTAEVVADLACKTARLHREGLADIIIDPGFGFAKTAEQNWQLLAELQEFESIGAPILVGLSRKSMLYRPLGIAPEDALGATIAANAFALTKGAHILRVHDVADAIQTVRLFQQLTINS